MQNYCEYAISSTRCRRNVETTRKFGAKSVHCRKRLGSCDWITTSYVTLDEFARASRNVTQIRPLTDRNSASPEVAAFFGPANEHSSSVFAP